jgi:hypothetical protein
MVLRRPDETADRKAAATGTVVVGGSPNLAVGTPFQADMCA